MQGLSLSSTVVLGCWIFCCESANAGTLVYTNDFDGGESFVAGVSGGLT